MDLPDLARICELEELRICRGMSEVADTFERIDSGVMCRGPAGSWVNTAVGLGFGGEPGREVAGDVAGRVVEFYASRGVEPRVELAPYACDAMVRQFADAGFVVRVYENILFRPLRHGEVFSTPSPAPAGLELVEVDPGDVALVREACVVVTRGFTPPGAEPREEDLDLWMRCAAHARTRLVAARLDGRVVGAGSVEVTGPIAALFGLSVLEGFRRRGVQQALIARRLSLASRGGAEVATIGARPRVATERNVRRMGFQVAYTKTILVRPGAGLAPVVG